MKEYSRPIIEEEVIEIEDVIASSPNTESSTSEGIKTPFGDLFG